MLFLSPWFLWGLLAALLPVIIHLVNRRRHQTIQWAAMQFLLKATRQARGKRKLRNILILTCRCLLIGGLVMAAARPVVSSLIGWGQGSMDTVVLVLDRSASMEVRFGDGLESRRERILAKVRDAMADLGNPRLVLMESASGQPVEVASPDVLAELSAAAATDTAADIPMLLHRAAEFLESVSGRSEIWLASDLQASNWKPESEEWVTARASLTSMPLQPRIRVLSFAGETAPNLSIRLLSAGRVGHQLKLEVEVLRFGKVRGAVTVPLTTHLNGVATSESLTLADQSLVFQKTLNLPEDSVAGHGWLSIPADGNSRDNAAFFAYGPSRDAMSLVVSAPCEAADVLALMAAPPGLDGFGVQVVAPEEWRSALSPETTAVMWSAPLPVDSAADELKAFLSAGGHVLFFPPGVASSNEFLGVQWLPPESAERDKYLILQDWSREDGLLRDGIDGVPIAAGRFKAIQRQTPKGDIAPLARWEDGEPALVRKVVDGGVAWFLASLPDYTWSNLADADLLLPAVQRLMDAGAARFDQAHHAGLNATTQNMLDNASAIRVSHDPLYGDAPGRYDAGVYAIGDRLLAVNRPALEDAPEVLASEDLRLLLDGLSFTLLDQPSAQGDDALSKDVWRVFLVAALLVLIVEAMLCLPKRTPPVVLPAASKI